MDVLVNTRGHYPAGYPKDSGGPGGSGYDPSALERATGKPDLQVFKTAINDVQGGASNYFWRNGCARDWWYARWPYQTTDGRKWGEPNMGIEPWPWPGASDSRIRTVEKVIGQHRTLATYALRNMKVQAKSTRPAVTMRESQQATTLLNWFIGSHMQAELHLELRLAISWRNGYGSAVLHEDWKQTRRLNYIDVSVMGLQEFVNEPSVQQFIGSGNKIPIGENLQITDLQEMIMDPAYQDDLAQLLRSVSHEVLSLRQARAKLDDLRALRTVDIPIPDVFESRPRIVAKRPMVDVLFPDRAYDFQIVPWYDVIEFVSETTLRDRIVTSDYNPKFVEEAIQHRGPSGATDWRSITATERSMITGGAGSMNNDIELHHFYTLVQDRGVPARFCTVFHMDLDYPAKHEPYGYEHGEATIHPMRFEIEDRELLSSRGIAEIAYTWEQELKAQYDAQSDRTAITLRPPLMTTYDQLQKIKESIQPGVIFPMRKFDEAEFMKLPAWDQVSILVVQEVEKRVRDHFAIFGEDVDPDLKKLRQEEFVDDILAEFKKPMQQMLKLAKQLLPDPEVSAVVGALSRPFHISRQDLQGDFETSGTVDLRDMDHDWLKEKIPFAAQILQMDTLGITDKAFIIKSLWQSLDYSYADMAVQSQQPATQAEIQDEQKAIDLIIGSGQDQPLPQGSNYQLRKQVAQAKLQTIPENPATMQIVQQNPNILKVIMNRIQFFDRQLQQQQNAQIGRMQVSNTFSKDAPTAAAPSSALLGY